MFFEFSLSICQPSLNIYMYVYLKFHPKINLVMLRNVFDDSDGKLTATDSMENYISIPKNIEILLKLYLINYNERTHIRMSTVGG